MIAGEVAVMVVELVTFTFAAGATTLSGVGAPPASSMNLTVEPALKPVPVIVSGVPPMIEPLVALSDVTVGTVADHTQLVMAMVVPQ